MQLDMNDYVSRVAIKDTVIPDGIFHFFFIKPGEFPNDNFVDTGMNPFDQGTTTTQVTIPKDVSPFVFLRSLSPKFDKTKIA